MMKKKRQRIPNQMNGREKVKKFPEILFVQIFCVHCVHIVYYTYSQWWSTYTQKKNCGNAVLLTQNSDCNEYHIFKLCMFSFCVFVRV